MDAISTHVTVNPCDACVARHFAICSDLEPQELAELRHEIVDIQVAPGDEIFAEGDPADHVFTVINGVVQTHKLMADGRRQVTGFPMTGDLIGLEDQGTYVCSAEALSPTTMCRLPRASLENLTARYPALERRLIETLEHQLAAAQSQMLLLGRKTAQERLASFLMDMASRYVALGRSASCLSLHMTRSDIADYLGLTTETVSRAMTQFKKMGVVELQDQGRIVKLDIDAITDLAEQDAG